MTEKSEEKKRKKRGGPTSVLINVSNTRFSIVRKCCEEIGFKVTESTTKNLVYWCDTGGNFEFASNLCPWQFYNHFPGTWAMARKVELARNIAKMERLLPNIYNFHPKSFIIPSQTMELQNHLNSISQKSKRTFIVKPDRGSFGKGIVLIQDSAAMDDWYEDAIAQQYVPPYLIDGLKFDLRVYALVSSIEPLRIYIHDEGLARFCTQKYVKPGANNLELSFAHLTNYALNKNHPDFEQPTEADKAEYGHKRSMTSVFRVMRENGVDVEKLKQQIEHVIRLTVISVQPYIVTSYRTAVPINDGKSRCFEVLGFDILIDKMANPWLLEVNWAPSLAADSPFDVTVKKSVLSGAFKILDIPPSFKRMVMNRRRIMSQQRTTSAPLCDPNRESELVKETNYRQIYPLPSDHAMYQECERAFAQSKAAPVGASIVRPPRERKVSAPVAQPQSLARKTRMSQMKPIPSYATVGQVTVPRVKAKGSGNVVHTPMKISPTLRLARRSGPKTLNPLACENDSLFTTEHLPRQWIVKEEEVARREWMKKQSGICRISGVDCVVRSMFLELHEEHKGCQRQDVRASFPSG